MGLTVSALDSVDGRPLGCWALCSSLLRALRALMDSLGASIGWIECGESVVSIVDGFDWIDSSDWPALLG